MKAHPNRTHLSVAAALLVATMLAPPASMQTHGAPERFTAFAVSTGGAVAGTGAGTVEISVTRWSTDEERQRLIETLQTKGPNALLEALRDIKSVGTIRTPDSLGYPLHYAHQRALEDGGRRIVIATDRPISFWEQVNRPRTVDYPFTVIEMKMGPDGTGEGRMAIATRVIAHDNVIELENYDIQPVMLQQIKSEKR